MAATPHIGDDERRARVQARHHLGGDAASAVDVAGRLCGLHATDPATVYLSLHARVAGIDHAAIDDALYEQRSLVRLLGMRRTVFVLPRDGAAVMEAACSQALVAGERRKVVQLVTDQGPIADPVEASAWLDELAARVLAHLDEVGEASAVELGKAVPELQTKFVGAVGKSYEGTIGLSTRLLFIMALEGHLIRGRPLGTWLSSQYRWAHTDTWLGGPLAPWDPAEARAELARRWLATYGPAPVEDLKWWSGWTLGQARAALGAIGAITVDLDDGTTGHVLPEDLDATPPSDPVAALLPGLDPATMGWKARAWYLGDHGPRLFDRNGNGGPTIWWGGRIVGGWASMPDGVIQTWLLDDIGADGVQAVAARAEALTTWLDGTRVKSRFPTPLEKELVARVG